MVEKGLDEPQARLIYNQETENEKLIKQAELDKKRKAFEEEQEKLRLEREKIEAERKQAKDIENKKKKKNGL